MMLNEKERKAKAWVFLSLVSVLLVSSAVVLAQENATNATNETVTGQPTLWNIVTWFFSTMAGFLKNITEHAHEWFGIDPNIMMIFLFILFIILIRAKANGWLFWLLIIILMFMMSSGVIHMPGGII